MNASRLELEVKDSAVILAPNKQNSDLCQWPSDSQGLPEQCSSLLIHRVMLSRRSQRSERN